MKLPRVDLEIAAMSAQAADLSRHLTAQPVIKLSESQNIWRNNSVVHAGQPDVAPIEFKSDAPPHDATPKRAALIPARKPSPEMRALKDKLANVLPHLDTTLQERIAPGDEVAGVLFSPSGKLEETIRDLWYQPHNRNLSTQEVSDRIHAKIERGPGAVVGELIKRKIPVAQLIDAAQGQTWFDGNYFKKILAAGGLPSPNHWIESVNESTVLHTRLGLDEVGLKHLDGSGVKTWVLDLNESAHGDLVAAIVNDRKYGLAPSATVEKKYPLLPPDSLQGARSVEKILAEDFQGIVDRLTSQSKQRDTHTQLSDQLVAEVSTLVSNKWGATQAAFASRIKEFAASDAQVLNLIAGADPSLMLNLLFEVANKWAHASPKLARTFVADTSELMSDFVLKQKITALVLAGGVAGLNSSSSSQEAYIQATKAAADKGKIIVVSAGNGQENLQFLIKRSGITLPDSLALNPAARSEHVIVVGASKNNRTPLDVSDDEVAEFSARGGDEYEITTVTQGEGVAMPYRLFIAMGGKNTGTSFSAPAVGGVATLYKQVNPQQTRQSFEDFKNLVTKHSVPTGAPKAAEGAGMLDMLNAALEIGQQYRAQK